MFIRGGQLLTTSPHQNIFWPRLGAGSSLAHVFADAGYLVLLPNARGAFGYGSARNRAAIGNLGRQWDYDIDSGVGALVAKGWVDPDRIGVMGHSAGGDDVLYAITHSNRYKAAVIEASPILLPQLWTLAIDFPAWHVGSAAAAKLLIGFDPLEHVWADPFAIRTPLLMRFGDGLFGDRDPFLRRAQVEKICTALKRQGVPMEVIADRDGHVIANREYLMSTTAGCCSGSTTFSWEEGISAAGVPESAQVSRQLIGESVGRRSSAIPVNDHRTIRPEYRHQHRSHHDHC